jgi:hypothetical protein
MTLQRLTLVHGVAPAGEGGGAVSRTGGTLIVNQAVFLDNQGSPTGTALGGAIAASGTQPITIVNSVFVGNSAASGGALGTPDSPVRIYNTRFDGNQASDPAGNGGALAMTGAGNALTVCGATFVRNQAQSFGGAIYRLATAAADPTTTSIARSNFKDNQLADFDPSTGGAIYLIGTDTTVTGTAIVGNQAREAGGLYVGPGSSLTMDSTTVADNTATFAGGGGLYLGTGVIGTITGSTIARNHASAADAQAGAVDGEGIVGVTLANSIVAANQAGKPGGAMACSKPFLDGGANLQFPDDAAGPCAAGAMKVDPLLGELRETAYADATGKTWVMVPKTGSPALGGGATNCGPVDQLGKDRPLPCTLGAVEPAAP